MTRIWTGSKWEQAQEMLRARMSKDYIAQKVGVTRRQLDWKIHNERNGAHRTFHTACGPDISDHHASERDARALASEQRTPTQAFCGDPPPGYSALDKKRNGTAP